MPGRRSRGTFTVLLPRPRPIDRLAVDDQPATDLTQHLLLMLWYGSVRFRPDIQQQATVFRDDVHQVVDQTIHGFVHVVLDVAPRVRADRRVCLPERLADPVHFAPFEVQNRGLLGKCVEFVVDDRIAILPGHAVVVIGREQLQMLSVRILVVGFHPARRDPEIEPDQFGMILVDQFAGAGQPIVLERLIVRRPVVLLVVGKSFRIQVVDVPTVQTEVLRVDGVKVGSTPVIGPIESAMAGYPESHSFRTDRFGQLTDDVSLGPHLGRGPIRVRAIVHGKPVVVFGDGNHVLGSRFVKQLGPRVGVEPGSRQLRNEILVAKLLVSSVCLQVMFERIAAPGVLIDVHHAGIPLAHKCRYRVYAPVDEDSELRVLVPRGDFVLLQRLPFRQERSPSG